MPSSHNLISLISFAVGSSAALATSIYLLNQRHDEIIQLEEENSQLKEQNKTCKISEEGKKRYALLFQEERL